MTLKPENKYSNAISILTLFENGVLHQILSLLFKKVKIQDSRWRSFGNFAIKKYVRFPSNTLVFFEGLDIYYQEIIL